MKLIDISHRYSFFPFYFLFSFSSNVTVSNYDDIVAISVSLGYSKYTILDFLTTAKLYTYFIFNRTNPLIIKIKYEINKIIFTCNSQRAIFPVTIARCVFKSTNNAYRCGISNANIITFFSLSNCSHSKLKTQNILIKQYRRFKSECSAIRSIQFNSTESYVFVLFSIKHFSFLLVVTALQSFSRNQSQFDFIKV